MKKIIFPSVMVAIMIATIARYQSIQDFKNRSREHTLIIEMEDSGSVETLEKAIRDATMQEVEKERISDDRYQIIVRCPPEKIGYITSLIQKMGWKRSEN